MPPRRTVLTGLGLVTPLGSTTAATWDALRAGQSGIRPLQLFDAKNLPVPAPAPKSISTRSSAQF